jgi:hypothetical protein
MSLLLQIASETRIVLVLVVVLEPLLPNRRARRRWRNAIKGA